MSDQDYVAEKVLGKKIHKGKWHYQIKWVGYDDPEDITWEPFRNCWHCLDKIIEFDEGQKSGYKAAEKPKEVVPGVPQRVKQPKIDYPQPGKVYRLERGSTVAKILGVKKYEGSPGVVALVAYTDNTLEIVPTHIVGENQPEVLVEYYEGRLHAEGKPKEGTADAALEQEMKKAEEDAAQQENVDDVAQELDAGLAVGDEDEEN